MNSVQLRNRRRRRDEGLPELAEDVERLARLVYRGADAAVLEVLAKDQFIDALPQEDMRLRLHQMRHHPSERLCNTHWSWNHSCWRANSQADR